MTPCYSKSILIETSYTNVVVFVRWIKSWKLKWKSCRSSNRKCIISGWWLDMDNISDEKISTFGSNVEAFYYID